jgi:hypothetical protein
MRLETHGRWPIVGALGLFPISALAVRRPRLRPLAGLLWHQTEEWVWPGGFLPWVNREVIGSAADEFPLTRRDGLVVNTALGWGLSLAPLAGPAAAGPAAALYVSHLGNAALHVSWAVRRRRYDPGAVTALATLTPVAVVGLRDLARDRAVSRRALAAGALAGTIVAAAFLPAMKRRARRAG